MKQLVLFSDMKDGKFAMAENKLINVGKAR